MSLQKFDIDPAGVLDGNTGAGATTPFSLAQAFAQNIALKQAIQEEIFGKPIVPEPRAAPKLPRVTKAAALTEVIVPKISSRIARMEAVDYNEDAKDVAKPSKKRRLGDVAKPSKKRRLGDKDVGAGAGAGAASAPTISERKNAWGAYYTESVGKKN